jgi:hypothetical protein
MSNQIYLETKLVHLDLGYVRVIEWSKIRCGWKFVLWKHPGVVTRGDEFLKNAVWVRNVSS